MPQNLKQGTAYMLGGLGASMLAGFGAQVVLSRGLGPEQFGTYGLTLFNSSLVAGFLSPGVTEAMTVFVSENETAQNQSGLQNVVQSGLIIESILVIAISIPIFLFFDYISNQFFQGARGLVLVSLTLAILRGFYGLFAGVIVGLREMRASALLRVCERGSLVALLLFFLAYLEGGVNGSFTAEVLALFLTLGISIRWSSHFLKKALLQVNSQESDNKENISIYLKDFFWFAAPVTFTAMIDRLIQSSGPVILSTLTDDDILLGIFVLLLTLTRMLDRIIKTVSRSVLPYLVQWNTSNESKKVSTYLKQTTIAICSSYAILIIVAYFFGSFFVQLAYGADYILAAQYLPITLLAYMTISLQDLYRVIIFSIKAQKQYAILSLLGVCTYLATLRINNYVMSVTDPILIIFIALALANLTIIVGEIFLIYRLRYTWHPTENQGVDRHELI